MIGRFRKFRPLTLLRLLSPLSNPLPTRTPLHFAVVSKSVQNDANHSPGGSTEATESDTAKRLADVVSLLSDEGGAACMKDGGGMLPMHYACAYGTSTVVLEVLQGAFPDSIAIREDKGRTPLHLAMVNGERRVASGVALDIKTVGSVIFCQFCCCRGNGLLTCRITLLSFSVALSTPRISFPPAHRWVKSPDVVKFLLAAGDSYGIVDITDNEGHLPLYLFAMASKSLG